MWCCVTRTNKLPTPEHRHRVGVCERTTRTRVKKVTGSHSGPALGKERFAIRQHSARTLFSESGPRPHATQMHLLTKQARVSRDWHPDLTSRSAPGATRVLLSKWAAHSMPVRE